MTPARTPATATAMAAATAAGTARRSRSRARRPPARTRRRTDGSDAAGGAQRPADPLEVGRLRQVGVYLARGARVETLRAVAGQDHDRGVRRRAADARDDL